MVMNLYEKEKDIISLPASTTAFDSHINGAGPYMKNDEKKIA